MSEDFENIVEIKSLWRIYKVGPQEVAALRGIDLKVAKGRFISIKGRSGSGKTTLLNCLGGLDKPTKGSIFVSGQNLAEMTR
jgi:putative ABC transport system ATP-binding protein